MKNVSNKSCRNNQNIFSPKIVPVMKYCGKSTVEPEGSQMKI